MVEKSGRECIRQKQRAASGRRAALTFRLSASQPIPKLDHAQDHRGNKAERQNGGNKLPTGGKIHPFPPDYGSNAFSCGCPGGGFAKRRA
jgi:hypothetical protein